jgi:ribosomal protein L32
VETLYCYQKKNESRERLPDRESETELTAERSILCKECGHRLTSHDHAMEVEGKHRHTFFNPAGVLFEIGCFSDAAGAEVWGVPTTEFAWFAGFAWRFANCAGCRTHIGWQFLSGADRFFYGLVLSRLIDEV